jgi:hypothetical protein
VNTAIGVDGICSRAADEAITTVGVKTAVFSDQERLFMRRLKRENGWQSSI